MNIGELVTMIGADISNLEKGIKDAKRHLDKYSRDTDRTTKGIEKDWKRLGSSSSKSIEKMKNDIKSSYERIEKHAESTTEDIERAHKEMQKEIERINKKFYKDVDNTFDKIDRRTKESGKTANMFFKTVRAAALGYATVLATMKIQEFVSGIVQQGVAIDSLTRSYKAITGSMKEAQKQIDFVTETSRYLGLSLTDLEQSYKGILAASKNTALEGETLKRIFSAVTKASAVLGMSADDTSGTLRALSQMISKGNVQAEELRGQLGERLPGAFQMAAEAMGVTTMGLNDMLERGEVLAEELLPALAIELEKRFGEAAKEAGNTARAAFQELRNEIVRLQRAIAESGVLGLLTDIAKMATKAAKEMQKLFPEDLDREISIAIALKDDKRLRRLLKIARGEILEFEIPKTPAEKYKEGLETFRLAEKASIANHEKLVKKQLENEKILRLGFEQWKLDQIRKFREAEAESMKADSKKIKTKEPLFDREAQFLQRLKNRQKMVEDFRNLKIEGVKEFEENRTKLEIGAARYRLDQIRKFQELEKEGIKEFNKKKEQAIKDFNDDYMRATLSATEYEIRQLKIRYNDYAESIKDKQLLDKWYSNEKEKILEKETSDWDDAFSGWLSGYSSTLNDMLWESEWSFKAIARSFSKMLTHMIIQKEMMEPLLEFDWKGGLKTAGKFISGFFHEGGIVGAESIGKRAVPAETFANAPRLHNGLMPGEYPAILEKGEGVFTEKQMAALGSMGNNAPNVQINIENKSKPVKAGATRPKWDGEKWVISVVLEAMEKNKGGFTTAMKSMVT